MKRFLLLSFILLLSSYAISQNIPAKPEPARLVNDFAGIINDTQALEDSLVRFEKRTSTQIVVVTMATLDGYPIAEIAQKIGESWGVGQKSKNNGAVILVKPKSQTEYGEAFIATGYGLEGALPDALAARIVEKIMIPHFKNNDYSRGTMDGAIAVMKATDDEYTADDKLPADDMLTYVLGAILIIIYLVIKSRGSSGGSSLFRPSSSLSGWGSFSSGSGSFGGFGGGSFGGGGGGGRW